MSLRMTEEEYAEWMARRGTSQSASLTAPLKKGSQGGTGAEPRRKYRNQPTVVDGIRFDSKHEAEVYAGLMLRRRAGELWLVLRQVRFDLPGGITYVADFLTADRAGNIEIIDAKSPATARNRVYINKRKQMFAVWGVVIREL